MTKDLDERRPRDLGEPVAALAAAITWTFGGKTRGRTTAAVARFR